MKNTWWIIKLGGTLTITAYRQQCSVGPYWSVEEALKMIEKWR